MQNIVHLGAYLLNLPADRADLILHGRTLALRAVFLRGAFYAMMLAARAHILLSRLAPRGHLAVRVDHGDLVNSESPGTGRYCHQ